MAHHRHGIWCFCVCGLILHCTNLISCHFNCMKMCSSRHSLLLFLPTEWPEIRAPLLVPSSQQDGSEHSQEVAGGCCRLAVSFLAPGTQKMFADSQESVLLLHPVSWLGVMALGLVSSLHLSLSCVFLIRLNATASAVYCPSRAS